MDPFDLVTPALAPDGTPLSYQVASQTDIPNYWLLAQQFVLGDDFFSSLHGPSFPNHLYALAAQSGGDSSREHIGQPILRLDFEQSFRSDAPEKSLDTSGLEHLRRAGSRCNRARAPETR